MNLLKCLGLLVVALPEMVASFIAGQHGRQSILVSSGKQRVKGSAEVSLAVKQTLTEETTWKFQVALNGMPTENGRKVDDIFTFNCKFIEDVNYEPPQGTLSQVMDQEENYESPRLSIVKSRWQLSEDPNDRKDSLWVWGLFEEPLYPFLLLQFETDSIPLPGDEDDSIRPMTLYAQINHSREKNVGAVLKRAEIKIRRTEKVAADVFGVSKVELYEEAGVGTIGIEPFI